MKMMNNVDGTTLREFDREMFRSSLVSLFWAVISDRKRRHGYKLKDLAAALNMDKSNVSRWFSQLPNWEANTISDLANALDLDLRIVAQDRSNGRLYTPAGVEPPVAVEASGGFELEGGNRSAEATGVQRFRSEGQELSFSYLASVA